MEPSYPHSLAIYSVAASAADENKEGNVIANSFGGEWARVREMVLPAQMMRHLVAASLCADPFAEEKKAAFPFRSIRSGVFIPPLRCVPLLWPE